MSAENVLVQIAEPVEMLEESYALLPYVKVDDRSMMVLNEEIYKEQVIGEPVLCVPMPDIFDYDIHTEVVEQADSGTFLSDHTYTFNKDDSELPLDLYFDDVIQISDNSSSTKLKCPLCEKVLKATDAFYRHLRVHSGEKPYQCELCDKKFSQQSNLWKHVLIHTGERRFQCPHCNKKFSQRANMQKHMMVHTGEKPFACSICAKSFTQRANLNKHIRIHTGEKPYSCKYCSRQFAQQSNMQKHELLHKGLKPFVCMICTMAFTQQSNLKKHVETHYNSEKIRNLSKSYSCLICRKLFSSKSNIYRHMEKCRGQMNQADDMGLIQIESAANNDEDINVFYLDDSCVLKVEIKEDESDI